MDSEQKDSHQENMKSVGPIIKKPFEESVFNKSESPPSRLEGNVFHSCSTTVVPKEDGIVSNQFSGNEKQRQEAASLSNSYDESWDLWKYYEHLKTRKNEKCFDFSKNNTKDNGKSTINVGGTLLNQSTTKVVSQDRGQNCDTNLMGGFGDVVRSPITLSTSTSSSSYTWDLSDYRDLSKTESKERDSGFWKTKPKDYGKSRVKVDETTPDQSKTKVVSQDQGRNCDTNLMGGFEYVVRSPITPSLSTSSSNYTWDLSDYNDLLKTESKEKDSGFWKTKTKDYGKSRVYFNESTLYQSNTKVVSRDKDQECRYRNAVNSPIKLGTSASSSSDTWDLSDYNDLLKTESKEKDSSFWKTQTKDNGKSRVDVNETTPNQSKIKVVSHDKGQECNTNVMCSYENVVRSPIIRGTSASSSNDSWDLSGYNYLERVFKSKTKDYDKSRVNVSRTTPNQSKAKVVSWEQDKDCDTNVINGYGNVDRSVRADSSSSSDTWGLSEFRDPPKTEAKDKYSGFWKSKTKYNEKSTAYLNGTPSNQSKTTVGSHNQGLTNVMAGYKNGEKSPKIQNPDTSSSSSAKSWGLSKYRDLLKTEKTDLLKSKTRGNDKTTVNFNGTPPNQSKTKVVSHDQGQDCGTFIRDDYDESWDLWQYYEHFKSLRNEKCFDFSKSNSEDNGKSAMDVDGTLPNQGKTKVVSQDQGQDCDTKVRGGYEKGDRSPKIQNPDTFSSSSDESWGLSEYRYHPLNIENSVFWKSGTKYNDKSTADLNGTQPNQSKTKVVSQDQGQDCDTKVRGGYEKGDRSPKIQDPDTFSSSSDESWGLSEYRDHPLNIENSVFWKSRTKYNDKRTADLSGTQPNQSKTKVVSQDQGEYCDTNVVGGLKNGDRSPKRWNPSSSLSSDESCGLSKYRDLLDTEAKDEYTSCTKTRTKENDKSTIEADGRQPNQSETMVKSQDQCQDFDNNVMDGLHSSHMSPSRGDRNLKIGEHNRAESGDIANNSDFSNTKAKDTDEGPKSISDLELNHGMVDAPEVARQVAIEAEREVEVQREISDDQNVDSSQVPSKGNEPESKGIMGFDLNLKNCLDDTGHPLDTVTTPVSIVSAFRASAVPGLPTFPLKFEGAHGWKGSGATSAFRLVSPLQVHDKDNIDNNSKLRQNFTTTVSIVSSFRASAVPGLPAFPLKFEGAHRWKGVSSTSAFRLVSPLQVHDRDKIDNSSKPRQNSLDFDLNLSENREDNVADIVSKKQVLYGESFGESRLKLDLNRLCDEASRELNFLAKSSFCQNSKSSEKVDMESGSVVFGKRKEPDGGW